MVFACDALTCRCPVAWAAPSGSYGVLYAVAGVCAILGAGVILRVKGVR